MHSSKLRNYAAGLSSLLTMALLCFAFAKYALAQSVNATPAHFLNDGKDIIAAIEYPPQAQEGTVTVRGAAKVSKGGTVRYVSIHTNSEQPELIEPFEQAVVKGLGNRWKISPAIVNGKQVKVWFNFSVVFEKYKDSTRITLHESLVFNPSKHPSNYIDPQRYGRMPWPAACGKHELRELTPIYIGTNIDKTGTPTNPRVLAGEVLENCKQSLLKRISEATFIPAMHNGNFVSGTHIEAWF
ncbi:energy transducer TonB [Halioxenophilus aromaticivorans]|uniref:TonB C-terminal domain-containing protein n=1 Tax=Halioxenophilus aromaticivorans TaxID=1306992 RepID=A0AAV3U4P0_9ALTE